MAELVIWVEVGLKLKGQFTLTQFFERLCFKIKYLNRT